MTDKLFYEKFYYPWNEIVRMFEHVASRGEKVKMVLEEPYYNIAVYRVGNVIRIDIQEHGANV
jgi:hypothetical protein